MFKRVWIYVDSQEVFQKKLCSKENSFNLQVSK